MRERFDASIQGVKKLFVLAYSRENGDATENSHRKYSLPRMKIKNYNIENDGRNFYDQSISDLIKKYDEVRKISTGHGDDYTTVWLLDYVYLKDDCRLNTADLRSHSNATNYFYRTSR